MKVKQPQPNLPQVGVGQIKPPGTAGFSPWFHLSGQAILGLFLTHSQVRKPISEPEPRSRPAAAVVAARRMSLRSGGPRGSLTAPRLFCLPRVRIFLGVVFLFFLFDFLISLWELVSFFSSLIVSRSSSWPLTCRIVHVAISSPSAEFIKKGTWPNSQQQTSNHPRGQKQTPRTHPTRPLVPRQRIYIYVINIFVPKAKRLTTHTHPCKHTYCRMGSEQASISGDKEAPVQKLHHSLARMFSRIGELV